MCVKNYAVFPCHNYLQAQNLENTTQMNIKCEKNILSECNLSRL